MAHLPPNVRETNAYMRQYDLCGTNGTLCGKFDISNACSILNAII